MKPYIYILKSSDLSEKKWILSKFKNVFFFFLILKMNNKNICYVWNKEKLKEYAGN